MTLEALNFKTYLQQLSSISDADFELAVPYLKQVEIKKGDYFLREGAYCSHLAFINSGLFRLFTLKKGTEFNSCFCLENDIFSSFDSLVNKSPSKEFIQALEDSIILTFPYKSIEVLGKQSPAWNIIRTSLTEKECLRLANRINEMSFESALEKYQNLMANAPEIIQRVSNFHIASYLGISRETLSRIRAKIS